MDTRSPEETIAEENPRRHSRAWILALLAVGAVAVVVTALRDDTPPLTAESLSSARARWERQGITDYSIELLKELDGQAPELLRTTVRGGTVTELTIDGRPANRGSYSVDDLFDMIERELEIAGSPEKQPGQPREVTLRALFDGETGVPLVFKRLATDSKSVVVTVKALGVDSE